MVPVMTNKSQVYYRYMGVEKIFYLYRSGTGIGYTKKNPKIFAEVSFKENPAISMPLESRKNIRRTWGCQSAPHLSTRLEETSRWHGPMKRQGSQFEVQSCNGEKA